MDLFTQHLRSVDWWTSVVFVSLVIGIVANYAKSLIDRSVGGLTKRWRESTQRRFQERERAENEWAEVLSRDQLATISALIEFHVRRATFKITLAVIGGATLSAALSKSSMFPRAARELEFPIMMILTLLFGSAYLDEERKSRLLDRVLRRAARQPVHPE